MGRNLIKIIMALVVAALAGGGFWWWQHPRLPERVNASIYETDMIEALVRGLLKDQGAAGPPVCFLTFGEGYTPPSPDFVQRFDGSHPALKSSSSAVAPPIRQFFEKSTGRPGMVIHIIRFEEYVPRTFDILVSFSNLPPGHDRFTYRITNLAGEWLIKSRKPA